MYKQYLNRKGFTFIEIVIVVTMIIILLNITLIVYPSYQLRTQLDLETHELIEKLRSARFKTMKGEYNAQYGLHLDTDQYVLFRGNIYTTPGVDDEVIELSPQIEINNVNLNNSVNDIVFNKGDGSTENYGSLAIRIRGEAEKRVISINRIGNVEWEWQ